MRTPISALLRCLACRIADLDPDPGVFAGFDYGFKKKIGLGSGD